jgi:RimJ/RimL family protein N-acetyltransferase/GNAT superfamily N-acetyltransferase
MKLEPVRLEGQHVRLEPLSESHHAGLCEIGLDPELWQWIPFRVLTPEEMANYIRAALRDQDAGVSLPFATIDRESGRTIGSTRYMNIEMAQRRVEIGSTWIGRAWQRSMINTEAKFLMLRHAFETLGCIRVELKTDSMNRRSRNAIQRIGATQEGIFRNHMQTWSGRIRDTVYFSILDSEWPRVKADLESKLARASVDGGPADTASISNDPRRPRRVDRLSESHIEDLHRLYQNEWWTDGRTLDQVRHMLDATRVLAAFVDPETDRLIAFARVITDETFKALVLDVIVDSAARQRGLGKMLMDAVTGHQALARVQHFELYCRPELIPFLRALGIQGTGRRVTLHAARLTLFISYRRR